MNGDSSVARVSDDLVSDDLACGGGDCTPLGREHLQALRAMRQEYARALRRLRVRQDSGSWAAHRLRLADDLVADLSARLGAAQAAGDGGRSTRYELTEAGLVALSTDARHDLDDPVAPAAPWPDEAMRRDYAALVSAAIAHRRQVHDANMEATLALEDGFGAFPFALRCEYHPPMTNRWEIPQDCVAAVTHAHVVRALYPPGKREVRFRCAAHAATPSPYVRAEDVLAVLPVPPEEVADVR